MHALKFPLQSGECLDKDNINLRAVSLELNRLSISLSQTELLLSALSRRGLARSGRIISVQNGERSFCSKGRHDEEKSFNGHSFSQQNEERRVQSHRFLVAWHMGKESVKGTLLPRLINIVVLRCWAALAAADRSPAADIVLELRSSYY